MVKRLEVTTEDTGSLCDSIGTVHKIVITREYYTEKGKIGALTLRRLTGMGREPGSLSKSP
jgi:hypothetical protein